MQKRSAERQRHFVDRAKADLADTSNVPLSVDRSVALASGSSPPDRSPHDGSALVELEPQRSTQLQQQSVVEGIPDSELEFQEALIEEREVEIRGIETGIHELHEIFRDLGTIVSEQQSMLGALAKSA